MGDDAVVTLQAGTYTFCDWNTGRNVHVTNTASTILQIEETMTTNNDLYIGPECLMSVYVRSDGVGGVQPSVTMGRRGEVHGRFWIPNGRINLGDDTDLFGKFWSDEITSDADVNVDMTGCTPAAPATTTTDAATTTTEAATTTTEAATTTTVAGATTTTEPATTTTDPATTTTVAGATTTTAAGATTTTAAATTSTTAGGGATTTTAAGATTTTAAATNTTTVASVTTTPHGTTTTLAGHVGGSTVPGQSTTTTGDASAGADGEADAESANASASAGRLPFTGGSNTGPLLGFVALCIGGVLVLAGRGRAASRRSAR
jgi:hypothetical protein